MAEGGGEIQILPREPEGMSCDRLGAFSLPQMKDHLNTNEEASRITREYTIRIRASAKTVWEVLHTREDYDQWTNPFSVGFTFYGEWDAGQTLTLLDPKVGGTRAIVREWQPHSLCQFEHVALVDTKGNEDIESEDAQKWIGAMQRYKIEEEMGETVLTASLQMNPFFQEMFDQAWPECLELIRERAESRES